MTLPDLLKALFVLLILAGAGYYFVNYEAPDQQVTGQGIPCREPLVYKIGPIDTRFGISEREVESAMREAVALWSEELDRPVAFQSEEGNVTISFIYDERQELVDGELRFRERLESEQLRLNQFHREYEQKKRRFDERSDQYKRLANETVHEIDELNTWVQERSRAGGLTEQDAQLFDQKKSDVERKQEQVKRERTELEQMASELNRDADRLNRMTDMNNRLVDQYNDEYSGEKRFAKATYQNLQTGGSITVNSYLSKSELVLILAHELGHAFGIDHLPDPAAVMHNLMGGQELFPVLQLAEGDKEAIRGLCD